MHRARRDRHRIPLVLLVLIALVVAGGAATGGGNDVPHGDTEAELQERHDEFLEDRSDPSGTPRPDLWQQGIDRQRAMRVSASLQSPPVEIGSSGAAGILSAGGVTGAQWTQIGPQPLRIDQEKNYQGAGPDSGEVVDIAVDPSGTTDSTVYLATNDGGIWKTTDGGATWRPRSDYMPSLSMGAVALDPVTPSTVYAGTGNNFDGGLVFTKGIGIYKSLDGGDTWTIQNPGGIFSNRQIVRIVMPAPNLLVVATNTGVYKSVDGGAHFGNNAPNFDNGARVLIGYVTDLHRDTATAATIYAALSAGGLMRSTDSGTTFPTDIFDANIPAHADVTFSQSTSPNANTMYTNVRNSSLVGARIFRTTDATAAAPTWSEVTAGTATSTAAGQGNCQCSYDRTIGIDPTDVSTVYVGYQKLWATTDGGMTFNQVSDNKVHWDQHALAFSPHSTTAPAVVYTGNDGGIANSADRGQTWANLNNTIATNLFNSIDIGRSSAANNGYSYGGTQDTGIIDHRPGDPGNEWHLGIDGDGAQAVVSRQDPTVAWGTDNGCLVRTTDSGNSWTRFARAALGLPACGDVLAVDPNNQENLFLANGSQLFRSTNAKAANPPTFTAIHPGNGFTAAVRSFATLASDSNTLWLGFSDGSIQRTANALAATPTWTTVTPAGGPGAPVGGLALDPDTAQVAVATFEGFSGVNPASGAATRHVFRTADNGANWADVSGTDGVARDILPDLPTHSVVIDPDVTPHAIIVSNDAGVLRTSDTGRSWQILGVGLPTVWSSQLQIDRTATPTLLRLGTYGRSVYELRPATGPLLVVDGDPAFGDVGVGHALDHVIKIRNLGSTDLHVNGFARTSGSTEFTVASGTTPITVAPGGEADFTLRFLPTSLGSKAATFRIDSDDQFQPIVTLNATGAGVKNQTTTSVTSVPNPSFFGNFVDITATVSDVGGVGLFAPSGTVDFFDGSTFLGRQSLDLANPGHATLRTAGLQVGTHQLVATYSGDNLFLPSTSAPHPHEVRCNVTITGPHRGGLIIGSGATCLDRATLTGSVVVQPGAALSVKDSTISGSVGSRGAKALTVCGSRVGSLLVTDTTGFVLIGDAGDDGYGCSANTIAGSVGLERNAGQLEFSDNHVAGSVGVWSTSGLGPTPEDLVAELERNTIKGTLACLGNVPAPIDDGKPNTVGGNRSGQCRAPSF